MVEFTNELFFIDEMNKIMQKQETFDKSHLLKMFNYYQKISVLPEIKELIDLGEDA